MINRKERRKLAKQEARNDVEARRRRGRILRVSITAFATVSVVALVGVGGYRFLTAGKAGRGLSSVTPGVAGAGAPTGKKSADEVQAELNKKEQARRSSPEWIWGEAGETEKLIEAYQKLKGESTKVHEERSFLLRVLGETIKPRAQWPKAYNDAKLRITMLFLKDLLAENSHRPGIEYPAALRALTSYAKAIPEVKPEVEEVLLKYRADDSRYALRSVCLELLSRLQSERALPELRKDLLNPETSTSRSAAYSLANYLDAPESTQARKWMLQSAEQSDALRPLLTKLLAYHHVSQAATLVPKLLTGRSSQADIEAAAYAIEQLRLSKYRYLLHKYGRADTSFLQSQLDAAYKATGE